MNYIVYIVVGIPAEPPRKGLKYTTTRMIPRTCHQKEHQNITKHQNHLKHKNQNLDVLVDRNSLHFFLLRSQATKNSFLFSFSKTYLYYVSLFIIISNLRWNYGNIKRIRKQKTFTRKIKKFERRRFTRRFVDYIRCRWSSYVSKILC